MARSLTERVLSHPQRVDRPVVRAALSDVRLWPPMLLAILTVLVVMLAYTVRPVVRIDLGDPYDSAYLQDFHAREVDAAGAGTVLPWPSDQNELTLPGRRRDVWIATVTAADEQPADVLSEVALEVNGQRVSVAQRGGQRQFIAIIPADLAAADQIQLRLVPSIVGNPDPPHGIVGQVEMAPARTYRWTQAESVVQLPGLGRGNWQVELTIVTAHPNEQPLNAQIFANDTLLATLPDNRAVRRITLMVPAALMQSGDLELTLRSNTFEDPRPLGLFVSNVVVAPVGDQGALTSALEVQGGYRC